MNREKTIIRTSLIGIGANIFKLAGSVILYGIVSVYVFGLLRLLVLGG